MRSPPSPIVPNWSWATTTSPANVVALLEVVRGRATSSEVLATSMALARKLNKVGVIAGNAGFIETAC